MMHCTENSLPVPSILYVRDVNVYLFSFLSCVMYALILMAELHIDKKKYKQTNQTKEIYYCCAVLRTHACVCNNFVSLLNRWFLLSISRSSFFGLAHKKKANFSFPFSNNLSSSCSVCEAFRYISMYGCGVSLNQYI